MGTSGEGKGRAVYNSAGKGRDGMGSIQLGGEETETQGKGGSIVMGTNWGGKGKQR